MSRGAARSKRIEVPNLFRDPLKSSVLSLLLRLPLKLIPGTTVVRIQAGIGRGLRWVVGAGPHGYWLGTYEWDVQQCLAAWLIEGDHFVDIGANAGFYTLLASRLVGPTGRVTAIEPLPKNLAFIRRHLDLNALQNVDVIESAASDHDGVARFLIEPHASMGHLKTGQTDETIGRAAIDVRTVTLDVLLTAGRLAPAKVVKIDVEGAELSVLQGARHYLRSSYPIILLSGHGTTVQRACEALLHQLGYHVTVRRDGEQDGMYESVAQWQGKGATSCAGGELQGCDADRDGNVEEA